MSSIDVTHGAIEPSCRWTKSAQHVPQLQQRAWPLGQVELVTPQPALLVVDAAIVVGTHFLIARYHAYPGRSEAFSR